MEERTDSKGTEQKLYERMKRIRNGVDSKLRKEQAGFRWGRETTEEIFVLRNIIEQSTEWQSALHVHFLDFEKAFVSIHRDSLWQFIQSYGIPSKMISMMKALCNDFGLAARQNIKWLYM